MATKFQQGSQATFVSAGNLPSMQLQPSSKRQRLSNELMSLGLEQTPKKIDAIRANILNMGIKIPPPTENSKKNSTPLVINYEAMVMKQQKIIFQLEKQIKYLKQYIKYFIGQREQNASQFLGKDKQNKSENPSVSGNSAPPAIHTATPLHSLLSQILESLQISTLDQLPSKIHALLQKANKKLQPVFVERIKLKEVPVPIQIIREVVVQKEIIKEIQKVKIVQVPIFREKIVERYIYKPPQEGVAAVGSPKAQSPLNQLFKFQNASSSNKNQKDNPKAQLIVQQANQPINKQRKQAQQMKNIEQQQQRQEQTFKKKLNNVLGINLPSSPIQSYVNSNNRNNKGNENSNININTNTNLTTSGGYSSPRGTNANANQTFTIKSPKFRQKCQNQYEHEQYEDYERGRDYREKDRDREYNEYNKRDREYRDRRYEKFNQSTNYRSPKYRQKDY